jgi:formylglycine-generating enzyme required for sulfatase activity
MKPAALLSLLSIIILSSCTSKPVEPPEGVVKITGGEFYMGYEDGDNDEKPEHKVRLSDFYMAETEVTNALYGQFDPTHKASPLSSGKSMPVCDVTWEQAVDFCRWMNRHSQGTYRLPTEAEWEYAARGPQRYLFGYADTYSKDKSATGISAALPVKEHEPNGYGLYGMSGNVSEWVFDNYDANYYHKHKDTVLNNPKGSEGALPSKVIRGPSFLDKGNDCRLTRRMYSSPGKAQEHVGFRYIWEP